MRSNWQIGTILGIPFYVDSSWFFIVVLVALANTVDLQERNFTGHSPILSGIIGLSLALLLFGSVLLHELGHSLVARSQGIKVNSITLFLFGGVASIERESKTPRGAFWVAIAGPLVSFLLFIAFSGLKQSFGEYGVINYISTDLSRINLVLALFNLIPGLPLDGGQVLKALVWQITGDRLTGIRWAAATGKFLGILGIALGIMAFLQSSQFSIGALWIAFIGWFILRNATAYEQLATLQTSLRDIKVSDAMSADFRVVNAHLSLREFVETYVMSQSPPAPTYFCASEGRYRGLINLSELNSIERSQWDLKTLAELAYPLTDIPSVTEKASLIEVIQRLDTLSDRRLTVLSPAGAVAGTIDRGDIVRVIAAKHKLPIPETEIQRIKTEGTYPTYFPLSELIKGLDER